MKLKRQEVQKVLTYGTLQSVVENIVLKMSELRRADMAAVRTHIFNRLMNKANQLKSSVQK